MGTGGCPDRPIRRVRAKGRYLTKAQYFSFGSHRWSWGGLLRRNLHYRDIHRVISALRALPRRGWRIELRWAVLALFGFAGIVCGYDILVFEPVSPLVLAVIGVVGAGSFAFIQRRRHANIG